MSQTVCLPRCKIMGFKVCASELVRDWHGQVAARPCAEGRMLGLSYRRVWGTSGDSWGLKGLCMPWASDRRRSGL